MQYVPLGKRKLDDLTDTQLWQLKNNIPGHIMSTKELMEYEFPEPVWIVRGILPEGLTILSGPPKSGKSWLALNFGVACSVGSMALGTIPVDKITCLYLALEDSPRRLKNRMIQMNHTGFDSDRLHINTRWNRGVAGLRDMEGVLDRNPNIKLVIIDTLGRFRDPAEPLSNPYQFDYDSVNRIKTIADDRTIAILLIHHTRKSTPHSKDFVEEVYGSQGTTAGCDSIIVLSRKRGQRDGELHITGRDIPDQELALSFNIDTGWSLLGDAQEYRRSGEQSEIIELVRELGVVTPAQVARELGKNPSTTRTLMIKMKDEGLLDPGIKYGKYVLPERP